MQRGSHINHAQLESDTNRIFSALDLLFVDILVAGYIVEQASQNLHPRLPRKGNRILAVDDARFFLHKVQLFFKDSQYKFTCVYDGHDAIKVLKGEDAEKPDLFLLDTDLPDMSGFELAQEIRAAGSDSPIIFFLGVASRKTVMKALEVGASDIILKSSTREQMNQKIRKHLHA
jgi:PleD family two-component response regulator